MAHPESQSDLLNHLRRLRYSGASQVTIDGQTIIVDRGDLEKMISELEQGDLTATINNTRRPDFFVDIGMPWGV